MNTRVLEYKINVSQAGAEHLTTMVKDVKDLAQAGGDATPEFAALQKQLQEIGAKQAAVDNFVQLKTELGEVTKRQGELQQATQQAAKAAKDKEAAVQAATAAEQASAAALEQGKQAQNDMRDAVSMAKAELKQLKDEAKATGDESGQLATSIAGVENQLQVLQQEASSAADGVRLLSAAHREDVAALKNANTESAKAQKEFTGLREQASTAKEAVQQKSQALERMRDTLGAAGISSSDLAAEQVKLKQELAGMGEGAVKAARDAQALAEAHKTLGTTSQAELNSTANKAVKAYNTIKASGTATTRELRDAWAVAAAAAVEANGGVVTEHLKAEAASKNLRIEVDKTGKAIVSSLNESGSAAEELNAKFSAVTKAVAGLFAASKLTQFAGSAIQTADAFGQMAERVQMATDSQAEFDLVQGRLLETANITYRALGEQQEMYIRSADALQSLGYNTEQVLDITDSFSYLLATNAASAERGANAVDAYTKAIQSGKLDADGWNSILAATPTIVEAISEATGKSAQEIRQLGVSGKLAIEDLNEGLLQSVEKNKLATEGMSTTVNDALTKLSNTWGEFLRNANESSGATQKLAAMIDLLSNNLEEIAALATTTGQVLLAMFAGKALVALRTYASATIAAATAQATLAGNVSRTSIAVNAASAAIGKFSDVLKAVPFAWSAEQVIRLGTASWGLYQAKTALAEAEERNARQSASTEERMVESLRRISEETGVTVTSYEELTAAIDAGQIVADEASGKWLNAEQALRAVGKAAGQTQEEIRVIQTTALISEFEKLVTSGKKVEEAFRSMLDSLDFDKQADVDAFVNALAVMQATGVTTAKETEAAWQKALDSMSGDQLLNASAAINDAFANIRFSADQLAQMNDAVLAKSFEALGINAAASLGIVSKEAQQAIAHVQNIAKGLTTAGVEASKAAAVIEQAFLAALKKADSVEAVEALKLEMQALAEQGKLTTEQQERLTQSLEAQATTLRNSTKDTEANTAARQRNAKAAEQEAQAEINALRGKQQALTADAQILRQKAQLAKARGDNAEAARLETEAEQQLIEAEELGLQIREIELEQQKLKIQETIAQAQAQGTLNAEKERELTLQLQQISLQQQQIEHERQLLNLRRGAAGQVQQQLQQLGDQTEQTGDQIEKVGKKMEGTFLSTEAAMSKYAKEAAAHSYAMTQTVVQMLGRGTTSWGRYREAVSTNLAMLKKNADDYVRSMERLDDLDAALDKSSSGAASRLDDLALRLLRVNGTQEQIAAAEERREKAAVQLLIEKAKIEAQRAVLRKDDQALVRINEEIKLLKEEQAMIETVYAAERKKAEDEAKAAKQAEQKAAKEAAAAAQAEANQKAAQQNTTSSSNNDRSGSVITQVHKFEINGRNVEIPTTNTGGDGLNVVLSELKRAQGAS